MSNKSSSGSPALSVQKQSGCAGCFGWSFALIFLIAGGVATYFLTFRPLWGIYEAQGWTQTPCQIVISKLQDVGKGSSRLVIEYVYTVDGMQYHSDRFCFVSMSSNTSTAWKAKAVADHPVGKQAVCFVDPRDPRSAVIERGWVSEMWWCLFPIPFLLIGVIAFLSVIGIIRVPSQNSSGSWRPRVVDASGAEANEAFDDSDARDVAASREMTQSSGPVTLEPDATPFQKLIGRIIFALLWNAILSAFLRQRIQQFWNGGFRAVDWCFNILLIPFVGVGVGLIGFVFYSLLAVFNPRPTLVVSSAAIPLGEELRINWSLSGRAGSIREFTITLKGVEKATYRRGTTTTTDQSQFARIPIFATREMFDMEEGSAVVTIPADTMHSFSAANNEIEWSIEVHGTIPLWPDVSASFPITVLPLPSED